MRPCTFLAIDRRAATCPANQHPIAVCGRPELCRKEAETRQFVAVAGVDHLLENIKAVGNWERVSVPIDAAASLNAFLSAAAWQAYGTPEKGSAEVARLGE